MEKYNPQKIEEKWQRYWAEHPELYAADEKSEKEKRYILDMFPYPSGDGLHVGHVESYTATDIISRYLRMNGKNVLHPQGWDAFGLPAENYAIKTKVHPSVTTEKAVNTFKNQMKRMGFSYDWSREVNSSDPEYYKWTQWFFLLLYKNGLAYKKKAKVNWCDCCQTVLANEQAEGGICDRCKSKVLQKDLEQWFFKITDFIEDKEAPMLVGTPVGTDVGTKTNVSKRTSGLISGLDKVDWPESTKLLQKNWIGKSEGTQFRMEIAGTQEIIEVYTTRVDTVFGMTYAVVAPEHEIIEKLKDKIKNYQEVGEYIEKAKNKTDLERMELQKDKTGVKLEGIEFINPFTNENLPLFVADYVIGGYGTGAVMAVPAHDERDYAFAKEKNIKIIEVIKSQDGKSSVDKEAYVDDGVLINSGKFDDLASAEAREKITEWLEEKGIGRKKINYRLRDWLVSRQRYWGAPIPIIYCKKCGEVPVPEKDLPVELPDDVDFLPTGESPLTKSKKFHRVRCPKCGEEAIRESDTMDTFVCSSWYYFRYADPKNKDEFASKKAIKKWLPVDTYVGGAEHSVLHLLYSRFFTKVLHNLGYIDFDEPFLKLRHQGTILAEDGRKMSKSLGNVVNPDDVVDEYGADALRMFEMFMGPLEAMKPWNTKGIVGIVRFLEKVWNIAFNLLKNAQEDMLENFEENITAKATKKRLNKAIKKVSDDIQEFHFNTAISELMICANAIIVDHYRISREDYGKYIKLLAPFAPHIAEEIWQEKLGHKKSIFLEKWSEVDEKYLKEEEIQMVVQVNGKLRDRIFIAPDVTEDEVKETALESEKVRPFVENKEIKKTVFVPGRLINIVIK
ncbi:MAG TPA: leucine--tRNA ligase [Candidatus Moranbacteria bacterium]|nr:leucine--tRNA ligase [Candidatus Moranbacteria bacterium]HOF42367.1 leucine--tRNA ligase [Candidatus Moranbacteria bacterium]HPX94459.1 leucine--tRNA ligase [Candidatus Moranbacteria bacterium]HQB59636.1 leucine--tRNA ligase [Candidatus Moranbacteria bacterium]